MVEENRIFVGGLSQATSEQTLFDYFQNYGAMECKVFMDKDTGRSKGYGFVTFQTGLGADPVQEALSVKHTIDGKTVDCKISVQKGLAPPPQSASVVAPRKHTAGGHGGVVFPQEQSQWGHGGGKGAPDQSQWAHGGGKGAPQVVAGKAPASGAAPTQHKIFVGGLSQVTTKESMQEYFSPYGVCECVVMLDKETGRSRGFGFVTFESQEAVLATLSVQGHVVDGKQTECKACEEASQSRQMGQMMQQYPAQQYSAQQYPAAVPAQANHNSSYEATRIFVGGLPQTCDSNRLGEYFSQFGNVTETKVHIDPATNRNKGFGYVSFDSPHSVEMTLASGRNLQIDEKWVEVKRCEAKSGSGKGSGVGFPPAASFHAPPASQPDLGILLSPGSPAAQAAQYLQPEQVWEIRSMVHLLQDPTSCAVIQALIGEVNPAVQSKGGGKGARRYSPY